MEGIQIGTLSRLMGSEAMNYATGLQDLYEKMLFQSGQLVSPYGEDFSS